MSNSATIFPTLNLETKALLNSDTDLGSREIKLDDHYLPSQFFFFSLKNKYKIILPACNCPLRCPRLSTAVAPVPTFVHPVYVCPILVLSFK